MKKLVGLLLLLCVAVMVSCADISGDATAFADKYYEAQKSGDHHRTDAVMKEINAYLLELDAEDKAEFEKAFQTRVKQKMSASNQ